MKNVFTVPVDKDPLDFLKKLKEELEKNWIFLHKDLVKWLEENAVRRNCDSTGEFDKQLKVNFEFGNSFSIKITSIKRSGNSKWFEITKVIEGNDVVEYPSDPNMILFYAKE